MTLIVQDEPDRTSAGGFDLRQAIREVIPRQHDIRDGGLGRRVYGLEKDARVEPALLQNQPMRSHQSGKALVVRTRQFARSETLQAEGEVDVSEERGWKAGIDEGLEALDMQAGRIRVGAGDLTDCVLSHLGGQDEDGISQ